MGNMTAKDAETTLRSLLESQSQLLSKVRELTTQNIRLREEVGELKEQVKELCTELKKCKIENRQMNEKLLKEREMRVRLEQQLSK